jgi:hypothetical protein
MSAPVTRSEFQETIARLATKAELREAIAPLATKAELREAIAPLATKAELHEAIANAVAPLSSKADLEIWGGALMARMDAQSELLRREMHTMRRELQADLARHTSAIFESTQVMIRAIDDKYADLPGRVSKLESRVPDVEPR